MSPFRRKAVENAIVAVLRDGPAATLKGLRASVAERLEGCSAAELAAAVQSLRYAGKLTWGALELSDSMKSESGGSAHPPPTEGPEDSGGIAPTPSPGPDDEEDEESGVNDASSFVPPKLLHKAGVHGAQTRAAARPLPVPQHESEVARAVREEVEDVRDRRRRANSTSTVRQPLELRKFGVPDLNLVEGVQSLVVEVPHDLMVAVNRKHPQLWRRVIMVGRARGELPAAALYEALERGLDELEAALPREQQANAA